MLVGILLIHSPTCYNPALRELRCTPLVFVKTIPNHASLLFGYDIYASGILVITQMARIMCIISINVESNNIRHVTVTLSKTQRTVRTSIIGRADVHHWHSKKDVSVPFKQAWLFGVIVFFAKHIQNWRRFDIARFTMSLPCERFSSVLKFRAYQFCNHI